VRKTAAGFITACWIALACCALAACGSTGSVKQAASSVASSVTASRPTSGITQTPSRAPAPTPTTAPNTTAAPNTSAAPHTTKAQVTSGGTTKTAIVVPAGSASATASPTASSASNLLWLWVLLGAAVVIGLTAWIVHARRKHRAGQADWNTRLIDAYAQGAALHDAMAAAATPAGPGTAEATARWSDIQRRADDFGQMLYALQETAPDDENRLRIAAVLASLHSVRSALEAEWSTPHDTGTMSEVTRDRLSFFMSSLNELREPQVHPA
jgi:glucose/arabinose dehydrogenase